MTWEANWSVGEDTDENRARRGGQGRVTKVYENNGERIGALKTPNHNPANDRQKQRFLTEIFNLRAVKRAAGSVPEVYEDNAGEVVGNQNVQPFFVCEYIDGPTLSDYIRQNAPLAIDVAAKIVLKILETVRIQIEDLQLVHRDLKPTNIILRNGNPDDPVLVDYGLSISEAQPQQDDTPPGEDIGNRFIVFPEKLRYGQKRDIRTDINSIAGLLYAALTGRQPGIVIDENGNPPHRREGGGIPAENLSGDFVQAINNFFDRAFNHVITNRFQSVDAIEVPLQGFVAGEITPEMMNMKQLASWAHWQMLQSNRQVQLGHFRNTARDIRECFNDARANFDGQPFELVVPEFTAAAWGDLEPSGIQSPILEIRFHEEKERAIFKIFIRGTDVVLLQCERTARDNRNVEEIFSTSGFERPDENQLSVVRAHIQGEIKKLIMLLAERNK